MKHFKYTVRRCGQGLEQWICECGWATRTDILPDTARQEFKQHIDLLERDQAHLAGVVVPSRTWMTVGDVQVYHEQPQSVRVWARPKPS